MVKSILDNAPKATALLTFCVLILTIFHDWGYFSIIGIKFQFLQTPYDYIANSITWLPLSLSLCALNAVPLLVFGEDVLTRRLFGDPSDLPRKLLLARIRMFWHQGGIVCGILAVVLVICSYFVRFPASIVAISFAVMTGYFSLALFITPTLFGKSFSRPVGQLIPVAIVFPVILCLAFILGGHEALTSTSSLDNIYALTNKDGIVIKQVLLLRTLDKGALTYDLGNKKIAFKRWDGLTSMEHVFNLPKSDATFCELTEHICANPESP